MDKGTPEVKHDNRQWQLEQGADPTDNDEMGITVHNECSGCGYFFGDAELDRLLVVERSGISPGNPDCPDVYWFEGHVICPRCEAELFVADASA